MRGVTSKHNFQVQQAQWQTDKALVDATDVQGKAILDEAKFIWGKKLSESGFTKNSDFLSAVVAGRKVLLLITLPADKRLANTVKTIDIDATGTRGAARKAELVSAALQTDTTLQGESYFFETDGSHIRTGMRITAWIPEQIEHQSGVLIPKSALIWHLDQAFVYVKTGVDQFSRRNIEQFLPATEGYFVSKGLKAGESLVITGGQMLLSQEFKAQIPKEED